MRVQTPYFPHCLVSSARCRQDTIKWEPPLLVYWSLPLSSAIPLPQPPRHRDDIAPTSFQRTPETHHPNSANIERFYVLYMHIHRTAPLLCVYSMHVAADGPHLSPPSLPPPTACVQYSYSSTMSSSSSTFPPSFLPSPSSSNTQHKYHLCVYSTHVLQAYMSVVHVSDISILMVEAKVPPHFACSVLSGKHLFIPCNSWSQDHLWFYQQQAYQENTWSSMLVHMNDNPSHRLV